MRRFYYKASWKLLIFFTKSSQSLACACKTNKVKPWPWISDASHSGTKFPSGNKGRHRWDKKLDLFFSSLSLTVYKWKRPREPFTRGHYNETWCLVSIFQEPPPMNQHMGWGVKEPVVWWCGVRNQRNAKSRDESLCWKTRVRWFFRRRTKTKECRTGGSGEHEQSLRNGRAVEEVRRIKENKRRGCADTMEDETRVSSFFKNQKKTKKLHKARAVSSCKQQATTKLSFIPRRPPLLKIKLIKGFTTN